ncbi:hypothetical protein LB452_13080 [Psychroflexus sp. CAK8W]|uniref:RNA polymerase, alpha chain C terminal domain n=1 Tax=Psychroflexus longus TaxID=2873596 RepID=A0ABS7XLK7_9FLAO|nr:hypothetical protein [Psychroflexus longus]MBZ9779855.1 hypothetical protein [Psychroflexus longus]
MNQSEIEIKYILELIPSKLFKKLKILNISTAKEVMDIDLKEFSQIRGIGPTVIEQLQDFQETIHEDINSLIDLQLSKTREYILPIDFEDIESESFIEVFKETINDYLNLLDDDKLHKIISYSYGLNDLDKYTTDELAIYFENSSERIRQLKNEILNRLDKFLSGQKDENLRCKCENEISKHYLEIKSKIIDQKVLSKVSIYELVSPKTTITENFSSLIDLLIDVLGIHRCGKVETIFTTAEILILDKFIKGYIKLYKNYNLLLTPSPNFIERNLISLLKSQEKFEDVEKLKLFIDNITEIFILYRIRTSPLAFAPLTFLFSLLFLTVNYFYYNLEFLYHNIPIVLINQIFVIVLGIFSLISIVIPKTMMNLLFVKKGHKAF